MNIISVLVVLFLSGGCIKFKHDSKGDLLAIIKIPNLATSTRDNKYDFIAYTENYEQVVCEKLGKNCIILREKKVPVNEVEFAQAELPTIKAYPQGTFKMVHEFEGDIMELRSRLSTIMEQTEPHYVVEGNVVRIEGDKYIRVD